MIYQESQKGHTVEHMGCADAATMACVRVCEYIVCMWRSDMKEEK